MIIPVQKRINTKILFIQFANDRIKIYFYEIYLYFEFMKIRTKTIQGYGIVKNLLTRKGGLILEDTKQRCEFNVAGNIAEGQLREYLQEKLDAMRFPFKTEWVMVDGNTVWSYEEILAEIKKVKKLNSSKSISKYLYEFMHLNFTIAHYNIEGWKEEYPEWSDVKEIIQSATAPAWKTDVLKILQEAKKL